MTIVNTPPSHQRTDKANLKAEHELIAELEFNRTTILRENVDVCLTTSIHIEYVLDSVAANHHLSEQS